MSLINQVLKDLDSREPLKEQPRDMQAAVAAAPFTYQSDWLRVIVWTIVAFLVIALVVYIVFFEKQTAATVVFEPATVTLSAPRPGNLAAETEIKQAINKQSAATPADVKTRILKPDPQVKTETIAKTPLKDDIVYLPLRDDGIETQVRRKNRTKSEIIVKKAQLPPLEQARNLLSQGRLTEAEAQMKDMLDNNPADINALELLTGLLLRNQRLAEAQDFIQAGLKIYPYRENLILMQARILLDNQQLDQAISLLRQQVQANKAGTKTLTMLAPLYQQKANYTASASIYRQLVTNMPTQAANWVGLGISLEALAQKQEAVKAYRQALDNNNLAESLKQYSMQRLTLLTQQGENNE